MEWISVEERLPDPFEDVLCWTDDYEIMHWDGMKFRTGIYEHCSPQPSVWSYLPEPPVV